MKKFLAAALVLCTIALSHTAFANGTTAPSEVTIDQLRSRLNLTPEQQAKISPFVDARKARFQDVQAKMSSATSRRDKRAVMQEAKKAQDEFVRNVEPVLTAEQQAEWKKIRAEARDQMIERWRNKSG